MPFDGPLHTLLSVAWFLVKTYAVILVIFWIRGTYPRLRIDQLMAFGWKVLVPLSFVNIIITGIVLFYGWHWSLITLMSAIWLAAVLIALRRQAGARNRRMTVRVLPANDLRTTGPAR